MVRAELRVVGGKHHGQVVPLVVDKFLIGREKDCQLRPNTESVSRYHCVFQTDDYGVRIRDLGSTNGTFVNDERIHGTVQLHSGDAIAVGKLQFEIVIHESVEAAIPTAEPAVAEQEGTPTAAAPVSLSQNAGSTGDDGTAELAPAAAETDTTLLNGDTTIMPAVPPTPQQPVPTAMPGQPQATAYPGVPVQPMMDPQQMMQQQLFQQFLQQQYMQQQQAAMMMPPMTPETPTTDPNAGGKAEPLPVRLPDPEETGVRETRPTSGDAGGDAESKNTAESQGSEGGSTSTNSAADIIKKYRQRR